MAKYTQFVLLEYSLVRLYITIIVLITLKMFKDQGLFVSIINVAVVKRLLNLFL